MRALKRAAADVLFALSLFGLAALAGYLARRDEPLRPLAEAVGRAADAYGIPAPRVNRGHAEAEESRPEEARP